MGSSEVDAGAVSEKRFYASVEEMMPELGELKTNKVKKEESILPVDRRDFMALFGASAMLASTACIRRPVERAIPFVNQPKDMVPGVPTS